MIIISTLCRVGCFCYCAVAAIAAAFGSSILFSFYSARTSSRLLCVSCLFVRLYDMALRAKWNSRDQLTDNYHIALMRYFFSLFIIAPQEKNINLMIARRIYSYTRVHSRKKNGFSPSSWVLCAVKLGHNFRWETAVHCFTMFYYIVSSSSHFLQILFPLLIPLWFKSACLFSTT